MFYHWWILYPFIVGIVDFCRKWRIEMPSELPADIHMEEASLQVLGETEERHFWSQTKVRIVHQILREFSKVTCGSKFSLLDVGCGNGILMQFLSKKLPNLHCTGIDGHAIALKLARERVPHARLILQNFLRISKWNQREKYDAVTLLDVIEHLDNPIQLLQSLRKHVASNGILVVSVPAFQSLWSKRDVFLGHRKRYTKKVLMTEMHAAGWEVVHCNYAYSFMFFPVYLLRKILFSFISCSGQNIEASELQVVPIFNRVLYVLGVLEAKLQTKFPIPFGTSLYCVGTPFHSEKHSREKSPY